MISDGHDIDAVCSVHPKLVAFKQTLVRKGLTTSDFKLTTDGKSLLEFVASAVVTEIKKAETAPSLFDAWWKLYPGTDNFSYKGKDFEGSRALRVRKEDCRKLFDKITFEDGISGEEMVKALELDLLQKKEKSIKVKANQITFMQNTYTYLYQRTFDSYVDLVRDGVQVQESQPVVKDTDI